MASLRLSLMAIILVQCLHFGVLERIKDKMYEPLYGFRTCFRRLNGTQQVGCSSKRGGSNGVIHLCNSADDLETILRVGTASLYVPVLPIRLLTEQTLKICEHSNKVAGIIWYPLLAEDERPSHFSHDHTCPNKESNAEGTCSATKWNPYGTGLLFRDIPFPMFYLEQPDQLKLVKDCFTRFNNFSIAEHKHRSLCAVQMESFMFATTNTKTCLRRSQASGNLNTVRYCDILGDRNVWATLWPMRTTLDETVKQFKYIVVSARIDSTSMFDMTAGAQEPSTGLVTLLTVAKLLKQMLPNNKHQYDTNVLFVLFNGESYDYIGSQRFLYDLVQEKFPNSMQNGNQSRHMLPLEFDDIILHLELGQLNVNKDFKLFAHHLQTPSLSVHQMFELLNKYSNGSIIRATKSSASGKAVLPPASLQTFIQHSSVYPGLLLADYDTTYTNPYYNSIFDNASNINFVYWNPDKTNDDGLSGKAEIEPESVYPDYNIQRWIGRTATWVAQALYTQITNTTWQPSDSKNTNSIPADTAFINELFHCYLENGSCRVNQALQNVILKQPPNLYVGVDVGSSYHATLVGLTLSWVLGDDWGESNANCSNRNNDPVYRYYNFSKSIAELNETRCYRACMNFKSALSPAFLMKDYNWSSNQYSTWTESTWSELDMYLFLKPSTAHETLTLAIGVIVFALSLMLTYFCRWKAHILFRAEPEEGVTTDF